MRKRLIVLGFVFFFSLLLITYLLSTKRQTVFCSATHTSYGAGHTKTAPSNFEQLPLIIQKASNTYLKGWLGQKLFKRFKYYGGQITDRQFLSEKMKADSTIPDYVLYFSFSNEYEDYSASLLLSSSGKIVSDLDFPNVSKYPEKENIISQEIALEFLNNQCEINEKVEKPNLSYNVEKGSFVWIFDIMSHKSAVNHKYQSITIDAHSGKLIDKKSGVYYSN